MKFIGKILTVLLCLCLLTVSVSAQVPEIETSSNQLLYAQLQLTMDEAQAQQFNYYANQIEATQAEQRLLSQYLNTAMALMQEASASGGTTEMPEDMKRYMDENGLAYDQTGNDALHNADQWSYAVSSLAGHLEVLGTRCQTEMIYLQEIIVQNTGSEPSQPSGTTQALQNLARGQTMLSMESGTGMLFTGLLCGLLAGIVGTLLVQRMQKRTAK